MRRSLPLSLLGAALAAVAVILLLTAVAAAAPDTSGRWKWGGSGCYWDEWDDGPDQCNPNDPPPPTGRYKLSASGCYWDANDSGSDQCSPNIGHYKLNASGCYWASNESGSNQCSPSSGRYKLNASGCTWDWWDSGANQCSPYVGRYRLNNTSCYWDSASTGASECDPTRGRYKLNSTGCYWDATDTGTNQCSPASGRYKLNATGCYWDLADTGANQCSPASGRYKLNASGCYWDAADTGANQCSPAAGRYKLNASGCYWDAADSGSNQCSPAVGRYKLGPAGCYWDPADAGAQQCSPSSGRYKLNASGCYWDGADSGPAQCSPTSGRYKLAPEGCYWDWNDDGPQQCVPGQNPPPPAVTAHTVRAEGDHFTIDGAKRFLLLASYNDALRAPSSAVLDADFHYLRSIGVDGIRIFPNWWHYGCTLTPASDDALFTTGGVIRDSAKAALLRVLDRAMANGLVVDMTFTRETLSGNPADVSFANYLAQVTAVAQLLAGGYPHVFFDLQNEYDNGARLTDGDVPQLLAAIRLRDPLLGPRRLVTVSSSSASKAGQIAASAGLSMASVHDPRNLTTWYQAAGSVVGDVVAGMSGQRLPVYFQEPMPFSQFGACGGQADPTRGHAKQAAVDAKAHGAAAWSFHTRTPFKLDALGYRALLDSIPDERTEIESLRGAVDATGWGLVSVAPPPPATLTLNGTPAPGIVTMEPGQTLTAAVTSGPGHPGDWVGLYHPGADARQYLSFKFLANGLATLPAAGSTSGTVTFTIADPGLYEVRLFADRDFLLLRSSGTVGVVAPQPTGRWKWDGTTCWWEPTDSGPNQCVPVSTNAERLLSAVRLQAGQSRTSANGKYRLVYQVTDGNVVLYRETDHLPVWATNTFLVDGYLELHGDGNLVQHDVTGVPMWASDTAGHPGGTLEVQVDGNLVLSDASGPYWASDTGEPPLIVTPTGFAGTDVITYYSVDPIGSVRLITDAQGSQVSRFDYLPFGIEQTGSTLVDRRSFAGQQRDRESGFDYFGARYYQSQTGRFTSVDPGHVGGSPENPQGWNGYSYALNNPFRFVDPLGTCSQDAKGNLVDSDKAGTFLIEGACPPLAVTVKPDPMQQIAGDINRRAGPLATNPWLIPEFLVGSSVAGGTAAFLAPAGAATTLGVSGEAIGGGLSSGPALMVSDALEANKLNHVFAKAGHKLGPLLAQMGSREAAGAALNRAVRSEVARRGLSGLYEVTVNVAGHAVTVTGRVVDGVARIGTAFIR